MITQRTTYKVCTMSSKGDLEHQVTYHAGAEGHEEGPGLKKKRIEMV